MDRPLNPRWMGYWQRDVKEERRSGSNCGGESSNRVKTKESTKRKQGCKVCGIGQMPSHLQQGMTWLLTINSDFVIWCLHLVYTKVIVAHYTSDLYRLPIALQHVRNLANIVTRWSWMIFYTVLSKSKCANSLHTSLYSRQTFTMWSSTTSCYDGLHTSSLYASLLLFIF